MNAPDGAAATPGETVQEAALRRLADAAQRARTDRIESQIPHLVELLHDADIEVVVLKGPSTRHRLYGTDEPRPTADVDLLVDPVRFARATRVLRGAGYRRVDRHGHSDALSAPGDDRADVDLHLALPFVTKRPRVAFATLYAHRSVLAIRDREIPVLDEPAHAVHLAIHAAVNRFEETDRTLDEWRRAYDRLGDDDRAEARTVAARLGLGAVWRLAVTALEASAPRQELVEALPLWEIEPRVASLRRAVRSGVPARVRWRDFQRMVALQLGDGALAKWRAARGMAPVRPRSPTAVLSKAHRLFAVTFQGLRRLLTNR